MSERDLQRIRKLLAKASAAISQNYFMLPVAHYAGEEPLVQYRERVYAYELYHQLRVLWPDWKYSLAGEVDKSGHPVIRGGELDKAKPDLLIQGEFLSASARPWAAAAGSQEAVCISKD